MGDFNWVVGADEAGASDRLRRRHEEMATLRAETRALHARVQALQAGNAALHELLDDLHRRAAFPAASTIPPRRPA